MESSQRMKSGSMGVAVEGRARENSRLTPLSLAPTIFHRFSSKVD
jgi:hypothetical protein